jgi:hypothetical protein
MIKEFVDLYMKNKETLELTFKNKHPENYKEVVCNVIGILKTDDYDCISNKRVHEIDDGDYQGTLVYIIGADGYQPDDYWYVKVGYGSCSGCDTIEAIREYSEDLPTEGQVKDYMTLCLHIVQGLKKLNCEAVC